MSTHLVDRLEILDWDEQPATELADGRTLTRAVVDLTGSAGGLTTATYLALMYYGADGTSSYVTVMAVTGTLAGRTGEFVLQGSGTYDGTTARGESSVVPGSATGALVGLRGHCTSESTHADYPFMPIALDYDFG